MNKESKPQLGKIVIVTLDTTSPRMRWDTEKLLQHYNIGPKDVLKIITTRNKIRLWETSYSRRDSLIESELTSRRAPI